MRVLFVSDDPDDIRIGAVKAPRRLAEALRAQGCHCDLLFHDDLGPRPRHDRLRLGASPWLAWRAVVRAWRERGPYDVIDAAGPEGFALGLLRRFGPYRRARLIVRSHGLERLFFRGLIEDHEAGFVRKQWYRRLLFPLTRCTQEAGAYRLADAAIVLNREELDLVVQRGWKRPAQVHLIPHGVLRQRWAEAPPPGAPRGAGVLFSGHWTTGKGVPYLAQAHRLLLAQGLSLPLTLLSGMEDPPDFAAEEAAIRRAFAPECQPLLTVLPRFHDQDAVFDLYRRHDLLVFPSSVEAFGLVVLEALSQRLPIICSRSVGASAFLREELDAVFVPPRDAAALARALRRLWSDPALRRRLAEAGYRTAAALTWDRAAQATLAAYAAAGAQPGRDYAPEPVRST